MAKGFIYVVTTVNRNYVQEEFYHVPTEWGGRLYFGPCKKPMRPRMWPGDWVFGISPANGTERRIVFVSQIDERMTFAEAYDRFQELRGPVGPIHVRPVQWTGRFPESCYQHIPGANHEAKWKADLKSRELDAFFVCAERQGWLSRWLGEHGPAIDDEILAFLKSCSVYGPGGLRSARNTGATNSKPIRHGGLTRGLHLETKVAEELIALCNARMKPKTVLLDRVLTPSRRPGVVECGVRKRPPQSWPSKPIRVIKDKC